MSQWTLSLTSTFRHIETKGGIAACSVALASERARDGSVDDHLRTAATAVRMLSSTLERAVAMHDSVQRVAVLGVVAAIMGGCSGSTTYPTVTSVVDAARADQLAFASTYHQKGIAFRGTVQKKGVKAATAVGFDFTNYGLGGGFVTGGSARRINVNYGYVFLGEGSAEAKRALCLFEPDNLKEAAALSVGANVSLSCLFSKFVGSQTQPTPVFWGCSVVQ
jgi:hypothetical protein